MHFVLISHLSLSQTKIDSLKNILSSTPESKERVDVLNNISSLSSSPDEYIIEAISLSEKLNYTGGLTKAYDLISNNLTEEGKYDSALTLIYFLELL